MRNTSPRSPFQDPEFLRSVNVVPYDAECDLAALRQREHEATYMFWKAQEREERYRQLRQVVFGIVFCLCAGAAVWIGCAL